MKELNYHPEGNYLVPNLVVPEMNITKMGKWALMKYQYLMETDNNQVEFMMFEGTLEEHLQEVQVRAEKMEAQLMKEMKKSAGLSEEMKANGQWMKYVQTTMMIQEQVNEIIRNEVIYND
ncbi:TnpV protein [Clostridium sp.]|uniref:TnpV protein n=1 Tax=Clostridium sp. TaxID=1506 RepID=UPI0034DB0C0A